MLLSRRSKDTGVHYPITVDHGDNLTQAEIEIQNRQATLNRLSSHSAAAATGPHHSRPAITQINCHQARRRLCIYCNTAVIRDKQSLVVKINCLMDVKNKNIPKMSNKSHLINSISRFANRLPVKVEAASAAKKKKDKVVDCSWQLCECRDK